VRSSTESPEYCFPPQILGRARTAQRNPWTFHRENIMAEARTCPAREKSTFDTRIAVPRLSKHPGAGAQAIESPYESWSASAGRNGIVYSAEDTKLGRRVALKFLPEELSQDPQALERFQREARAGFRPQSPEYLHHPRRRYRRPLREGESTHFIVMEYLEGRTSSRWSMAGPWNRGDSGAGIQIADGLEAAHAKGIIHRDVSPRTFSDAEGQAKILDFGLAKLALRGQSADSNLATAERLLTSPARRGNGFLMSPEQVAGKS